MSILYVEISGSDPKGVKSARRPFSSDSDGTTLYSASGVIWECNQGTALAVIPASLLTGFLRPEGREKLGTSGASDLLPFTRLACLVDDVPCKPTLAGFFEVVGLATEVQRLCSGGERWHWGWKLLGNRPTESSACHNSWLAVLELELPRETCQAVRCLPDRHAAGLGQRIFCRGAPFGCLAPEQLTGYLTAGIVSNCTNEGGAVLMADLQCLPGMEGAAVQTADGGLVGMLTCPLSHTSFDAEVPLIISAQSLQVSFDAWRQLQLRLPAAQPEPPQCLHAPRTISQQPGPASDLQCAATGASGNPFLASASGPDVVHPGLTPAAPKAAWDPRGFSTAAKRGLPTNTEGHGAPPPGQGQVPKVDTRLPDPEAHRPLPSSLRQGEGLEGGTELGDAVVAVMCGGGWASGVVVHASGVVLTVAHALGQARNGGAAAAQAVRLDQDRLQNRAQELVGSGGVTEWLQCGRGSASAPGESYSGGTEHPGGPRDDGGAGNQAWTTHSPPAVAAQFSGGRTAAGVVPSSGSGRCSLPAGTSWCLGSDTFHDGPDGRKQLVRILAWRDGHRGWHDAEVVYAFSALDIAILRIKGQPGEFSAAKLHNGRLKQGQEIFVVGHANFNPLLLLGPSVACGVVAKVIPAGGVDSMLITDAAVYPGASGGAVMSQHGHLLGLVTSNTRHAPSGRTFAKVNYSVAAGTLRPICEVLQTGDPGGWGQALAALDAQSEELYGGVWGPQKEPQGVLGKGRGSQGATRLTELLQGSGLGTQLPTAGRSKL